MGKMLKPQWLLPLILVGLVMGIVGGWTRLGWSGFPNVNSAINHGLLMTGCFMGTLISLERAIVLPSKNWLAVPLLGVLATIAILAGQQTGLVVILYLQASRYKLVEQWILCLGAIGWLIGNLLVIKTEFVPAATTWWIGFILFTIVGERLEFGKFLPNPPWSKYLLYALLILFFLGLLIPFHEGGNLLQGWVAFLVGLWLIKFDMAKNSIKKAGFHQYVGIGLMVGYSWLGVFGVSLLLLEEHPLFYDIFLHTYFLGFAFSMIWAHAPVILPAVFKKPETIYHPVLWWGWSFFQITLLGRMLAALLKYPEVRQSLGIINGWIVLGMFVLMAGIMVWKLYFKALPQNSAQKVV
ncbi:hypothetical protein KI659_10695 [Litoribacter alkaliphilus]|uniref:NnrS family protein n=1 Tax=Litoribacter ruber TaxID=702568 RepID=A0AAP2G5F7_9BACT|nr:hypothetical protein [Litoribacter alkaliphilus]MBS9524483.1 hypothetical protein [Litoribacter alkaliphilus]